MKNIFWFNFVKWFAAILGLFLGLGLYWTSDLRVSGDLIFGIGSNNSNSSILSNAFFWLVLLDFLVILGLMKFSSKTIINNKDVSEEKIF